jgi:hypothetical protein
MTRRRYPGDGLGPTSATVPRNRYIVCWKDPVQPEKGTVWFWCSPELVSHAQLSSDDGIPQARLPSPVDCTHQRSGSPERRELQPADRWSWT